MGLPLLGANSSRDVLALNNRALRYGISHEITIGDYFPIGWPRNYALLACIRTPYSP